MSPPEERGTLLPFLSPSDRYYQSTRAMSPAVPASCSVDKVPNHHNKDSPPAPTRWQRPRLKERHPLLTDPGCVAGEAQNKMMTGGHQEDLSRPPPPLLPVPAMLLRPPFHSAHPSLLHPPLLINAPYHGDRNPGVKGRRET